MKKTSTAAKTTNANTTAKTGGAKPAAAAAKTAEAKGADGDKADGDKPAATDAKAAETAGAQTPAASQPTPPTDGNGGDKPVASTDAKAATTPEAAAAAAEAPAPVDPFANLPRHTVGDAKDQLDLSSLEVSNARKYAKVHEESHAAKLPVMAKWKHASTVLIPGTNLGPEGGFKPTSVYGIIRDIVQRAGKAGIPAYDVATQLRQRSMGQNKRSHYCDKLPPVGWAEGWLNSAVTKNICKVHATKKAPALTKADVAAAGTEATPEQNAKAIADNTKAAEADAKAGDAKGTTDKGEAAKAA